MAAARGARHTTSVRRDGDYVVMTMSPSRARAIATSLAQSASTDSDPLDDIVRMLRLAAAARGPVPQPRPRITRGAFLRGRWVTTRARPAKASPVQVVDGTIAATPIAAPAPTADVAAAAATARAVAGAAEARGVATNDLEPDAPAEERAAAVAQAVSRAAGQIAAKVASEPEAQAALAALVEAAVAGQGDDRPGAD